MSSRRSSDQRVGGGQSQVDVVAAGRQLQVEHVAETGQRMLEGGIAVTGQPLADERRTVGVIDLDPVEPGGFKLQLAPHGLIAVDC